MKPDSLVPTLFTFVLFFFFSAAPASAACNPGAGQVAFYADADYKGACVVLGVGRYANSSEIGMAGDSISSAKLGAGAWAVSYQDAGYKGFIYRHEKSERSFPLIPLTPVFGGNLTYKHGDKISSVEVMGLGTGDPGPAPVATYLGNYPRDRSNGWSDSLQGVGHDQSNWFFAQAKQLWKFPVGFDLNRFVKNPLPAGVKRAPIPKNLADIGYNHLGDLVHHKGYLFIPLEASKLVHPFTNQVIADNSKRPLLAVYRASDLSFVGSTPLHKQAKAGWLTINPLDDLLYTSENNISNLNRLISYEIDFAGLNHGRVMVNFYGMKPLYDEYGRDITLKPWMQGGDFSDDGKFLFLVNGRASSDTNQKDAGIWIFDFKTGKKVLKSTGAMPFKFEYHPGAPNAEEPEGITYWSLNAGDAPNIEGNLHVILLNNDLSSADNFWLKHYRIVDIKTLPKRCNTDSIATCSKHGAACMVVHSNNGMATDACHWPANQNAKLCQSTAGIWTTAGSKYAKNHPDVISQGSNGTCASEVKNLRNLKTAEEQAAILEHLQTQIQTLPAFEIFTPQDGVIPAPSEVSISDVTSTSLTLSWMDNATNEYGVEVARTTPRGTGAALKINWKRVFNVEERVESREKGTGRRIDGDDGLQPGTEYCYRLRAYRLKEFSDWSDPVCARTRG